MYCKIALTSLYTRYNTLPKTLVEEKLMETTRVDDDITVMDDDIIIMDDDIMVIAHCTISSTECQDFLGCTRVFRSSIPVDHFLPF